MRDLSQFRERRKERKGQITGKKDSSKKLDWKALREGQEDFFRTLIWDVVQQVLEAEMDEALGASKGERTATQEAGTKGGR
jgi:transposase-like protein